MSTHTNSSNLHTCFPAKRSDVVQMLGGILNQLGASSETVTMVDGVVGLLGHAFDAATAPTTATATATATATDCIPPPSQETEMREVDSVDKTDEEKIALERIEEMTKNEKLKTVTLVLDAFFDRSTAVPSTAVPSTAVPSTAVPSTAVPSTTVPPVVTIQVPPLQSTLERLKQTGYVLTLVNDYITDPEDQMKVYRETIRNLCDELNRSLC